MPNLPSGISIVKMSIPSLVMVFVIYLVIHIVIAVMLKKKKEDLDNMTIDTPGYSALAKTVKWIGILHKWFPAIAVILILIGFYL